MSWTKRPDFEGFEALYCFHEKSLISSTVVMIVRQTTGEELAVVFVQQVHLVPRCRDYICQAEKPGTTLPRPPT